MLTLKLNIPALIHPARIHRTLRVSVYAGTQVGGGTKSPSMKQWPCNEGCWIP